MLKDDRPEPRAFHNSTFYPLPSLHSTFSTHARSSALGAAPIISGNRRRPSPVTSLHQHSPFTPHPLPFPAMNRLRLAAVLLLVCLTQPLFAQQKPLDAAQLQLALRKLNVLGSALYVAAHPDDENTAVIGYLGNDRLLRTAYLAMTRGDGGQNLLGAEKGELLGLIRTQELPASRRVDGAEQFFTRALDFR